MGIYRVRMPQLGETVEEGTVVSWLRQPGAEVAEGDPLLEISTDKVDSEIESTVAGRLARVLVNDGETVAVGEVLAEIEVEGLESDDVAAGPEVAPAPAASTPDASAPSASAAPGSFSKSADSGSLLLSPVVRRMIDEHGIDLDELAAFAPGPKISRKVIEDFLAQRGGQPSPDVDGAQGEVVPFTRIRTLTAQRMVASKATSAHVVTAIEVDFEAIAMLRTEHRDWVRREHGVPLTWLPFVACAVARTLGRFEHLNASVRDGEALVLHRAVNLGIAVDLEGAGLVVPVIPDAEQLGLIPMAQRIRELADRARSKSLSPDDVSGGTFTITGQGPHGTLFTAPIINQPQVAILSVDGIRKRPVVVEGDGADEIVAHHTGVLAMSWDHRAVDGVYAAAFLAALRDAIEHGEWIAELS